MNVAWVERAEMKEEKKNEIENPSSFSFILDCQQLRRGEAKVFYFQVRVVVAEKIELRSWPAKCLGNP